MLLEIEKKAQLTGHNAAVYGLAAGQEEGVFYSAGGDGWLVRWHIDEPELGRLVAKAPSPIYSIAPFFSHELMAAGTMEGGLHWLDLAGKASVKDVAHHEQGLFAILPLGENQALTGGGLGRLSRWDLDSLRPLETLELTHTSIRGLDQLSPGGDILAAASDQSIHILSKDLALKESIADAHGNSVFVARWHPAADGRIVSGGRDAQLKVWGKDLKCSHAENAHWFTINDVAFNPDGAIFATASRDKTIRIWDAQSYVLLKELNAERNGGHRNSVNRLLWLDGATLISASDDRSLIIWQLNR